MAKMGCFTDDKIKDEKSEACSTYRKLVSAIMFSSKT
jgi:hypothetical protein